ncbi:CppA family protein [Streptococcus gallolyticus]|uniref:CppA N-terminal domain-containing protein n=1 Tax=Streptococcus hepaticus TaxID=3349163 RepID=UPI001C9813E4|nr:CppA family protein [Streptococcus gallolyticus]MBY5040912.1 CppA family protein [Streptococcus gallolyticus]
MYIDSEKIVPALRVNNRSMNQDFFEQDLGLKTILEDGPFAEFSGHGYKESQLVLIESPSMRTRAVKGLKKLAKIIIKVENTLEVEALLARGSRFTKLFQGKNGYAFETVTPEKDTFLLHGEEDIAALKEILPPVDFKKTADFSGLTAFTVEKIIINSPQADNSRTFYDQILPDQSVLSFQEAEGEDLLAPADSTWDLDSLRFKVAADMDWTDLEGKLQGDFFKDKKETFIQATDPSGIELWFEK